MGHRVFHWIAVIKRIRQSSIVLSFLATKGKVSPKTFLNVIWNSPLDEYCLLVTWGLSRVFIFYNFAITFALHIFAYFLSGSTLGKSEKFIYSFLKKIRSLSSRLTFSLFFDSFIHRFLKLWKDIFVSNQSLVIYKLLFVKICHF